MKQCIECKDPKCPGPDVLREFKDWGDLTSHLGEEDITMYVNAYNRIQAEYTQLKEKDEERKAYHRKHQAKQKLLAQIAKQYLDKDEVDRVAEAASEVAFDRRKQP